MKNLIQISAMSAVLFLCGCGDALNLDYGKAAAQFNEADVLTKAASLTGKKITIDQLNKVDLRVGVVRACGIVEDANKLLRVMVDLGEGRVADRCRNRRSPRR